MALEANQPARAVRELERTGPYDHVTIWPAWLRGQALFRSGTAPQAVAEFLSLWKNADADLTPLIEARQEYARIGR